jgi:hypothetical protein
MNINFDDSAAEPQQNGSESATNLRLFCPHFAHNHGNNVEHSSLSWFKIETSLQLSYGFVTSSLRSRGVYLSLLFICAVTGSAYIPLDYKYLSRAIKCDARTLKNCIEELLANDLLLLEREREKIERATEIGRKIARQKASREREAKKPPYDYDH